MTTPTNPTTTESTSAEPTTATATEPAAEPAPKKNRLTQFGGVFLGIAALLLVRNVFTTFNSLDANPGAGFFELFFVTTDENGDPSAKLALMTWAPFVLAPIGVILALIGRQTAKKTK